jgi:hypothetical protein
MSEDTRGTIIAFAVGLALAALIFCATTFAAAPECTGDRHYDGVACCPAPDPAECAPCPDPAPCPTVTCDCVYEGGTTNYITVNRCPDASPCPAFVAPRYQVCKVKRDGTLRCPHPRAPRRVFVPLPVTG